MNTTQYDKLLDLVNDYKRAKNNWMDCAILLAESLASSKHPATSKQTAAAEKFAELLQQEQNK